MFGRNQPSTLRQLSFNKKKKTNKQKTARDSKDVEKLESLYILLVRMQNGTVAVRNSMELPQKIKSRTIK